MKWLTSLTLCVFIAGSNVTSNSTTSTTSSISSLSPSLSITTTSLPNTSTTNTTASTVTSKPSTLSSTLPTTTNSSHKTSNTTANSSTTSSQSGPNNTTNSTIPSNLTTTDSTSSVSLESTTDSSTTTTFMSTTSTLKPTDQTSTLTTLHETRPITNLKQTSIPPSTSTHIPPTTSHKQPNHPSSMFTSQVTSTKLSVTNNPSKATNIHVAITSASAAQKPRNGSPTTSFLDGSLSTTIKPKVNNTMALGTLYNSTWNISSMVYGKILASLNISIENITNCENVTGNIGNVSPYPSPISPDYSYPQPNSTSIAPYASIAPTQLCNVTRILKSANISYSFKPINQQDLNFITLKKDDPFVEVLFTLDKPEEHEDKRINETHESFCTQFSDHLTHEKDFNFNSSSFNHTHSVLSLDKCKQETSVIVFSDHNTWYKYPQGVFLYALDKILQYYHFDEVLTKFVTTIDDHKCMFDVRSKVQYSRDGDKYTHYLKRHVTSWGVCNNFYQHVNITKPVSLPK
ncbi:glycoprotein ORF-O [Elephant endotheliotropic herpesvirus 2]|nr:ORF-O glycoprotein [Elephant endotheliotropic herpesvirus 2]AID07080.1 ORF-O glycoprotein [Elephant endotheliotropic herpesvirus 2]UEH20549.1 glycoprotein ORF-O [Elephant endotheliotropic herpesvirus 2]